MRARRYPHVHLRPRGARKSLRVAAAMLIAAALSVGNVPAAWADPTPSPTSTARTSAAAFAVTPKPTFTGSMTVGSKLTAVTGTWKPTPDSFAYQWRRNGKLIAGATAPTYRLTAQDAGTKITLTVIGTKTGYPKTSVTSDAKAATTASFATAPTPSITGKAAIGSTLTGATGTWAPTPSAFAYQWKRMGRPGARHWTPPCAG